MVQSAGAIQDLNRSFQAKYSWHVKLLVFLLLRWGKK
jgi:hypothetical protein